jgi:threonine/homoserine/homoserine lactone efflux protein
MLVSPSISLPSAPARDAQPRTRSFVQGFLTQMANPKALIFFTAILPQFIDPAARVAFQVTVLGISSVLIELAVLGLYVLACHGARSWVREPRLIAPLERLGGVFLIAAGARLAAIRSRAS